MPKKLLAAAVLALAVIVPFLSFASENDLSGLVNNKDAIKVFVGDFANRSGQEQVSAEVFRKAVESVLLKRKAVKFQLVKDASAGDVVISGAIKKYEYLKNDPITSYAGVGGFMLDAATTENYARMDVEFTVTDPKTKRVLWKDDITNFIKRMMTPAESIPLICEKVARTFLAKSFGKRK
jgi:hypothetical protein